MWEGGRVRRGGWGGKTLVPDTVYPLLHVGVHELPLARLDVHGIASPFAGAVAALHALALHTAVFVVSVPAVHVCTFRTSRCWLVLRGACGK